jgi:hypothetical protein
MKTLKAFLIELFFIPAPCTICKKNLLLVRSFNGFYYDRKRRKDWIYTCSKECRTLFTLQTLKEGAK